MPLYACHRCGKPSPNGWCDAHMPEHQAEVAARSNPNRGTLSDDALRRATFERDGYQCVKCRSTENLERDHKIARANGGEDTLENSQTLCRRCNRKKGKSE